MAELKFIYVIHRGDIINILICTEKLPYPLVNGDSLRIYHISKCLCKNNNIFLLYTNKDDHTSDVLKEIEKMGIYRACIKLDLSNPSMISFGLMVLLLENNILSNVSFLKNRDQVINQIEKIISNYNIDIIHSRNLLFSLMISRYNVVPKIFDLVDSNGLYYYRELHQLKNPFKYIFNYGRFIALGRAEKWVINNFDVTTTVSPVDKAYLETHQHADIRVIPNGVDLDYFTPLDMNEDTPSIIFSGALSFSPNQDAVYYIYNEILPIVKSRIPNVKFYIVGRDPPDEIIKLSNDKIIVTGFVNDIRPYLQSANLSVAPMRRGGGIKNKILEALAMEKPVVTNSMGAESFDGELKKCLLIGDDVNEIANHIITLLSNDQQRINIGKMGRKILLNTYLWSNTSQQYLDIYKELLSSRYNRPMDMGE